MWNLANWIDSAFCALFVGLMAVRGFDIVARVEVCLHGLVMMPFPASHHATTAKAWMCRSAARFYLDEICYLHRRCSS